MRYVDPRASFIGGATTVASLAVGVSLPVSIGIGVVTLLIANADRALSAWRVAPPHPVEMAPAPDASLHPEVDRWLLQAEDATSAIRRGVQTLEAGPLRERLEGVAGDAEGVLADLRRLAAQATATRRASGRLDLAQLSTDLTRLTSTLERSDDPDVMRDLQRSVDAVREQLRIGRRLSAARVGLQTRIEASTLGLQQLAAQVGEMAALAPPGGGAWTHGERIDELTDQLDALRAGLSDVGAMTRRALGDMDPEGGDDVPIAP